MKNLLAFVLAGCLLLGLGSSAGTAQVKAPSRVFTSALRDIRPQTRVPILLPTKLPPGISEGSIKRVLTRATNNDYFISLFYTADAGASYAAGYGGSTAILRDSDIPHGVRVALPGGRTGIFRPVSCGGSCAPANLWWEQNGAMYQIQVTLGGTPEEEQKKILMEAAKSMVAVE